MLADRAFRIPSRPSMWSACLWEIQTAHSASTCTGALKLKAGPAQLCSRQMQGETTVIPVGTNRRYMP